MTRPWRPVHAEEGFERMIVVWRFFSIRSVSISGRAKRSISLLHPKRSFFSELSRDAESIEMKGAIPELVAMKRLGRPLSRYRNLPYGPLNDTTSPRCKARRWVSERLCAENLIQRRISGRSSGVLTMEYDRVRIGSVSGMTNEMNWPGMKENPVVSTWIKSSIIL